MPSRITGHLRERCSMASSSCVRFDVAQLLANPVQGSPVLLGRCAGLLQQPVAFLHAGASPLQAHMSPRSVLRVQAFRQQMPAASWLRGAVCLPGDSWCTHLQALEDGVLAGHMLCTVCLQHPGLPLQRCNGLLPARGSQLVRLQKVINTLLE